MLYAGTMADVQRVTPRGDSLLVHMSDGTIYTAFKSAGDDFVVVTPKKVIPPPTGGGGGGAHGWTVGAIPNSLTVKQADGVTYTLNKTQLTHASDIMKSCIAISEAANKDVIRIVLITAIVESAGMYMYANTKVYPETANYPHDRDASDSDSVGLFQQRPSVGWGTPKECMTTDYSVKAFLGGKNGPNYPSPRGLFDIAGWKTVSPGKAAQLVQGSAYPLRYDVQVPVANAIMDAMLKETGGTGGGSGEWQWPFQYSKWVIQTGTNGYLAQFNMARKSPVTGVVRPHTGLDFGAGGINGQPIPSAHAGTVEMSASVAAPYFGYGAAILIRHPDGTACLYAHRPRKELNVGDKVTKGQIIGHVGQSGQSTGPHLHWETWEKNGTKVNPRDFMKARGAPES